MTNKELKEKIQARGFNEETKLNMLIAGKAALERFYHLPKHVLHYILLYHEKYSINMGKFKVDFKRFTWEHEVCDFCTLYQENIITIVWDGNNPENPYIVFYKELVT